jgi:hypothetical protein
MKKISRTLIIIFLIFLVSILMNTVSAARVESGITEVRVGEKRCAEGQTFLVFTGGQNISITAAVGRSAYDKETNAWDYLVLPRYDKKNFEYVSELYDGGKYTVWLRTRDKTDRNTTVTLDMIKKGANIPLDQEHIYFNISSYKKPQIKVISPDASIPEERFRIEIDSGMSEEQEESTGFKITGRLTGGNIPVDKLLDEGDSFSPIDGFYTYQWEARDDKGVIDSGSYSFVVKDTVQTDKAVIVASCMPLTGRDVALDMRGTFVDNESATIAIYEGEKSIEVLRPSDIIHNSTVIVKVSSPQVRELTIKAWRMDKRGVHTLDSATVFFDISKVDLSGSKEEVSWDNIRHLDFNVNLPPGKIDVPYTLDVRNLNSSAIVPEAECIVVLKDWDRPDSLEIRRLRYDPKNESSLRASYIFNSSGDKDFYIQIRNPRGTIYGRCDLSIQDPKFASMEKISLWEKFIKWLKD